MANTRAISFWEFLNGYSIEIPIIQRDYAQGRKGKEELRKGFLEDIKNALVTNCTLQLDFVYGAEKDKTLNPLDGQQRLTTLWLLHWYIALRSKKLEEVSGILIRFSYETRISSKEFCKQLCTPEKFRNYNVDEKVVDYITKQTWFYSAWKQDPTIQSMLRMLSGSDNKDKLDGIEGLFNTTNESDYEKYWNLLTGQNCPIVFYYLPLSDFGLSDDLYIKMNARGKQLTSFENFKADLIGYINSRAKDYCNWRRLLDSTNGIPIKMDTTWTDIFWKNRSNENRIDEIFFTFINRFFWNELFIAKDNEDKNILKVGASDKGGRLEEENNYYKYLNGDNDISYKVFDNYKYLNDEIPIEFFEKLERILDNYSNYKGEFPICTWEEKFNFIPKYESSGVESYNQVYRVVFFAICKYFDHDQEIEDTEDTSFKRWMRVVWNLVSGDDENLRSEIRSTEAMRAAIKFIETLDSHNVYESLYNYDDSQIKNSAFDKRCKEEIIKVRQIWDGNLRKYNGICKKEGGSYYNTWEELIIDAEGIKDLKGTISFLYTNQSLKISWNDFSHKFKVVKDIYSIEKENRNTISDIVPYLCDDYLKKIFSAYTLSSSNGNLKHIFTDYPNMVHNFLMQQGKSQSLTFLQKDIMLLCKIKDYENYWIHEEWVNNLNVLSNYSVRRWGSFENVSFLVGNSGDILRKGVDILRGLNINLEDNNKILSENGHEIIKGLYINFKYNIDGKIYYFRWQTNGWVDMYNRDWNENLWNEGNHLHSEYSTENGDYKFNDADGLIQELNRCISEYK